MAEEKATGSFVGEVGFADHKRDLEPLMGLPEIGWVLASHAHGNGYATEAVGAAVAWSDADLSLVQSARIIDPENLRSIRVAVKCGYRNNSV